MKVNKVSKGNLLVAHYNLLSDFHFSKSVVLISECNEEGILGFVLNNPLDIRLKDLFPQFQINPMIYNGGPVEPDNLYFIHDVPHLIPNSIEISNGIYWGGDFETLEKLLISGQLSEENIRFFLGYSGWEQHQLNEEIEELFWIPIQNIWDKEILQNDNLSLWKNAATKIGGDFLLWANAPEAPWLN